MGEASDGPAVLGVNPQVGGAGIGDDGELLAVASELDVDEVLGVHVVLDGDMLTSGPSLGTGLDLLGLGHVVGDGEGVVTERDLVSGDKAEEGGKECGSVHG